VKIFNGLRSQFLESCSHKVIAKVMKFGLELLPTHYFCRERAAQSRDGFSLAIRMLGDPTTCRFFAENNQK
jgi:hypothetical protein